MFHFMNFVRPFVNYAIFRELCDRMRFEVDCAKSHHRVISEGLKGSRIANHAWSNNHAIDFENASVIDKGTFRTRKTLEAWHTTVTPNADNNSCPLPGQYKVLFNKYS